MIRSFVYSKVKNKIISRKKYNSRDMFSENGTRIHVENGFILLNEHCYFEIFYDKKTYNLNSDRKIIDCSALYHQNEKIQYEFIINMIDYNENFIRSEKIKRLLL